jgi:phosphoglycolate phosphatase-like HAD superfamily hydrolase
LERGRLQAEGAVGAMAAGASYFVFDLDGTLISLPVEWDKVREELRALTGTELEFAPFFLDVQNLVAKDPLLLGPILRTIDKYEAQAVPQARLEDGAKEALASLFGRAKLSLVTMQGRAACDRVLEMLAIGGFFASSFTREDSMDRTAQLRMALESLEAKEAESVFVGDRINDLKAARAAGVRFVMIRKRPDRPPADALYRSMAEFAASPWITG